MRDLGLEGEGAEGRGAAAQGRHAVSARARHRPRIRRGARGDPGVEEKRSFLELLLREVLYGAPQRPRIVGKLGRGGDPLVPSYGELDADSIRADRRGAPRRTSTAESASSRIATLDAVRRRQAPLAVVARSALLLQRLPAQHFHRRPGGIDRRRRHRLPHDGDPHGPLRRRPHAHGRGGGPVGRRCLLHQHAALVPEHRRRHALPLRHAGDQGRRYLAA